MKLALLRDAAVVALGMASLTAPAVAGERPVGVVELFTSQGCNSCPPADAVLAELAKRGDIITLAYHVDYWDYLGWRDTLATADNTTRQRDYGKTFADRSVYTPQAVVNGRMHVNGAERHAVESALVTLDGNGRGLTVDIDVERHGDSVVIATGDAPASDAASPKAHVLLVCHDKTKLVQIARGENDGRMVSYVNPVTEFRPVGVWHGKAARFELPAAEIARRGPGGCAVLLQSTVEEGAPGPILGAAVIGADTL